MFGKLIVVKKKGFSEKLIRRTGSNIMTDKACNADHSSCSLQKASEESVAVSHYAQGHNIPKLVLLNGIPTVKCQKSLT